MIKYVVLAYLSILITSCSQEVTESIIYKDMDRIPVKLENQNNKFSELISDSKYIKLETNPECLINGIDKLLYINNKYYILDARTGSILIFGDSGKFISKIKKIGNGPDEYSYIMDFDVDKKGYIYILDFKKRKILTYNGKGQLMNSLAQKYYSQNLIGIGNSTFITYQPVSIGSTVPGKIIYQKSNKVLNSFFPIDDSQNKISLLKPFSLLKSGNNILFNEDLSDTIYEINKDAVKAKYFIDFGKNTITSSLRNDPGYFMKRTDKIREGWRISNFFENSGIFTCSFNLDAKTSVLFYSEKSKKYFFSSCPNCDENKSKVLDNLVVKGIANDYFVSVISYNSLASPKKLLSKDSKKLQSFLSEENYRIVQDFNENDNPILFLFKIKEF